MANVSPLSFPRVTVGGKEYQLRFGLGAWCQLSKQGIGSDEITKALNSNGKVAMTLQLAASALGHFDSEGVWRSLNLSEVDLADRLVDGEFAALAAAITPALQAGKVGPVAVATVQPATEAA
jgi:hypothetical protein